MQADEQLIFDTALYCVLGTIENLRRILNRPLHFPFLHLVFPREPFFLI